MNRKEHTRSGRQKKANPKYKKNNAMVEESVIASKKWCQILCIEENAMYTVTTNSLSTEDKPHVSDSDLKVGASVIWLYQGAPYEAIIKNIFDKKPMPSDLKKVKAGPVYLEDSSSEEDTDHEPPKKKRKRRKAVTCISSEEEDSDSATTNLEVKTDHLVVLEDSVLNESSAIDEQRESTPQRASLQPETSGWMILEQLVQIGEKIISLGKKIDALDKKIPNSALLPQQTTSTTPKMSKSEVEPTCTEEKFITSKGVNLLSIKSAEPDKYALILMEALFTDEEMAGSCHSKTKKSTKPPLPEDKVKLMDECIDQKFGKGTADQNRQIIRRKCNQKCIDVANKRLKIKKEQQGSN